MEDNDSAQDSSSSEGSIEDSLSNESNIFSLKLKALKAGKFTDCVFLVGPSGKQEKVYAVKAMMKMCSPYMEGLFRNSPKNPIRIEHIDPHIFRLMTEYIHLSHLITPTTCEELAELLVAADHFLVETLKQLCIKSLERKIGVDTVWPVLSKVLEVNLYDVADSCRSVLTANTNKCLEHPSFLTASAESIEILLSCDSFDLLNEWQVINYCIKWAENQESARKSFRQIMSGLRLTTLSSEQLLLLSDYFTPEEAFALLKFSITNERDQNFPEIFCKVDSSRDFKASSIIKRVKDKDNYVEFRQYLIPGKIFTTNKTVNLVVDSDFENVLLVIPKVDIYFVRCEFACQVHGESKVAYNRDTKTYQDKPQENTHAIHIDLRVNDNDPLNFKSDSAIYGSFHNFFIFEPPLLLKNHLNKLCFKVQVKSTSCYRNFSYKSANSCIRNDLNKRVFDSVTLEECNGTPVILKSFTYIIKQ